MNSSIACRYPRFDSGERKLLKTARFYCDPNPEALASPSAALIWLHHGLLFFSCRAASLAAEKKPMRITSAAESRASGGTTGARLSGTIRISILVAEFVDSEVRSVRDD
jgi:hypothetical protein